MRELTHLEREAVGRLRDMDYDASDGLSDDLFLLVSSLVPLPNVDLLVVNQRGQILLARRKDQWYGEGWHIPGGVMRFGENFAHRIQETAQNELGCEVIFDLNPVAIRNIVLYRAPGRVHPNERGHNVSILFRCTLPEGYCPDNTGRKPKDNGYLQWFDTLPDDFLEVQRVYQDVLQPWLKREDSFHA